MTWVLRANLRGPAGYNAVGAGATDSAIAAFITAASGTTATRDAIDALLTSGIHMAGDGVTDDAPKIQALYDLGARTLKLQTGKTYLLNTPIFLDSTDQYSQFIIDMNGSTFKLGSGLPTTAAFTKDATTKWAIYSGTLRSALSAGVVTVTDATRSTGASTGGGLRLAIVNGVIDGQLANRALVFANRMGTRLENMTLYQGRGLLSWFAYPDVNTLINCHNRGSGVTDSYLIHQIGNGDGLTMTGCKADSSLGQADLSFANGAVISGSVGGSFNFYRCRAILIQGSHIEADQQNATAVFVVNSQITFDTTIMYLPAGSATVPAISVSDDVTNGYSEIVFRAFTEARFPRVTPVDAIGGPLIDIVVSAPQTTIIAEGISPVVLFTGASSGARQASVGPSIRSTETAIQTGITAGRSMIATGFWRLAKVRGAWQVFPLGQPDVRFDRLLSQPVITQVSATSAGVNGTLVNGTTYEYAVALMTSATNAYAQVSAAVSQVAGADGALRLLVTCDSGPALARVWRKNATGVLTAPTHYVDVLVTHGRSTFWDTGANAAGQPWINTSVPVPNTVAATNTTVAALTIGVKTYNLP